MIRYLWHNAVTKDYIKKGLAVVGVWGEGVAVYLRGVLINLTLLEYTVRLQK